MDQTKASNLFLDTHEGAIHNLHLHVQEAETILSNFLSEVRSCSWHSLHPHFQAQLQDIIQGQTDELNIQVEVRRLEAIKKAQATKMQHMMDDLQSYEFILNDPEAAAEREALKVQFENGLKDRQTQVEDYANELKKQQETTSLRLKEMLDRKLNDRRTEMQNTVRDQSSRYEQQLKALRDQGKAELDEYQKRIQALQAQLR
eukprot:TRINITY_DN1950_c0_g1_i2.p1 TRINITY_DN1950_c0_g1~~TRINITY_DN1950_c0_g1_i2.p1  ORF type:complete len:202 (-),score=58.69 TRINITY_DN1950_c0_g1_i2:6-611(-)